MMEYPDIDYINELNWLIIQLSYHTRKRKQLNEETIEEMLSLVIDLLDMLELYKHDKYDIY